MTNSIPAESLESTTIEQSDGATTGDTDGAMTDVHAGNESTMQGDTDNTTTTETDNDGTNTNADVQQDDFSLDIKYNKEHLSLNREEATKYAQMGKKLEALDPTLKKLEYLASADSKTLKDFVEDTVNAIEQQREEYLRNKADGDEEIFEALLEKDKADRGKAYEKMLESQRAKEQQEEQDEIKILSKEFNLLKQQVPEFQQFNDVPDKVLDIRNKNGISLYDAYLRHKFENTKQSEQEKNNQSNNATQSVGAIKGDNANGKPKWEQELMAGIWGS